MSAAVLVAGILGLLLGTAMPMCTPTEYTLYIEKPECDYCVAINTTICMGFCFSRDSNMKELVGPRFLIQRSCTYQEVEYHTAALPGCPPHADPHFTYPVALSCHCSMCNTRSDECAHKSSGSGARCSKPVRHLYSYPIESDLIQPGWLQLLK
ncbi:thyroid stimulating hormone subunit beta a [Colossoma macropomum]|uniref:thyroid stimulating hormone subunit beta a n=1 Tax=Colossoma macropomum TaxID=42526 RepID=UPI00186495B2|nr:thyroid stimulating hormone subunit beta a [Colossoma macropomum]